MIHSLSVIVPVLNKEDEIICTPESIDASIAFFHQHYDGTQTIHSELIVVAEGSTDRRPTLLAKFGQNKPYFKVIKHFRSLSIVRTGVRMQDPLHPYWKAAIKNTLP